MKIQLVNNKDEVIGLKERDELDYNTDIYRVSALWLTNSEGKALLAKRAAVKKKDPNMWGPAVAGTLDEGETYDQNIYKEAEEEIGLTGVKFKKGPKMSVKHPRTYFCQWYFARLDRDIEEFVMQEEEVAELAWFDIKDVIAELKINPSKYVPAMQQIIDELKLDKGH